MDSSSVDFIRPTDDDGGVLASLENRQGEEPSLEVDHGKLSGADDAYDPNCDKEEDSSDDDEEDNDNEDDNDNCRCWKKCNCKKHSNKRL